MPINTLQGIQEKEVKKPSKVNRKFENAAGKISNVVGSPYWFFFSILIILIWAPSGIWIGFDEIWHLHINSTTTILTFLMMSLLHASQKKWERRMEQLLERERDTLKKLEEDTSQLAENSPHQKQQKNP